MCGGWNKWRGATMGDAEGAPWTLMARCLLPLVCSQCQIFANILEKIILNFQGIWRTFISAYFHCMDNSENKQKILFLLYLI